MADFAPNYTARYRLRYSFFGTSHSMMWRVASTVTDPTALTAKIALFLADIQASLWSDWAVEGAEFALADTDLFLPTTAPASPTGAGDISARRNTDKAFSVSFIARSTGGNKGRMFLYGTSMVTGVRDTVGNDFRLTSAESADVSAAIVRLNETSPALVCNDDNTAIWYEYVNMKYNDRWLRRLRRG